MFWCKDGLSTRAGRQFITPATISADTYTTASLGLPGGLMCCFWTVGGNQIMLGRISTETGRTSCLQAGDWTRNLFAAPPCPCRPEFVCANSSASFFQHPNSRFPSFCDDSLHLFPCFNNLPVLFLLRYQQLSPVGSNRQGCPRWGFSTEPLRVGLAHDGFVTAASLFGEHRKQDSALLTRLLKVTSMVLDCAVSIQSVHSKCFLTVLKLITFNG